MASAFIYRAVFVEHAMQHSRHHAHDLSAQRRRGEMRRELTIDLDRPPIGFMPGVEGLQQFDTLLLTDLQVAAVAIRAQGDLAVLADLEPMMARIVVKPPAITPPVVQVVAVMPSWPVVVTSP